MKQIVPPTAGLALSLVLILGLGTGFAHRFAPLAVPDENVEGTWLGTLQAGGGALRIVFHISRDSVGVFTATLDSPDQGAIGIPVDAMSDQEKQASGIPEADVETLLDGQVRQLNTPWFRYFLTYDPVPTLQKVTCPVLAVNGEKDLQVPPKENLSSIEAALRQGGNQDVTVVELEGLNHLFQTAETGAPSEYATIEETFSPNALAVIGNWILKQTSE